MKTAIFQSDGYLFCRNTLKVSNNLSPTVLTPFEASDKRMQKKQFSTISSTLTIFYLVLFLLLGSRAFAQNYFGLLTEGKGIATVGINANPHLNLNADYLSNFDTQNSMMERFGLIAQANIPLFSQKGFDFDFRIGAGALFAFTDNFKTISGLSWNFSRTADLNGRYFHSGFKIDLFPGYYGDRWVFAPHLSMSYQPWIHLKHKEYAKQAFQELYPDGNGDYKAPQDGWFYQNNITFQTGVGVAYLQSRWQLNLTAGFQYQTNQVGLIALPDVGIMPFYGGVNFGYSITGEDKNE